MARSCWYAIKLAVALGLFVLGGCTGRTDPPAAKSIDPPVVASANPSVPHTTGGALSPAPQPEVKADATELASAPIGAGDVPATTSPTPGTAAAPDLAFTTDPLARVDETNGKNEVISFTGRYKDACLGGDGRYLVLYFESESRLAVFDVEGRQVSGYIPTGKGPVLFAASQDSVIVVKPTAKTIQRFDLATQQLRHEASLSYIQPVICAAMGHASQGPVCLELGSGFDRTKGNQQLDPTIAFLDIQTLEPIQLDAKSSDIIKAMFPFDVRAAANGQLFTLVVGADNSIDDCIVRIQGGKLARQSFHPPHGVTSLVPNRRGDKVFTLDGIYEAQDKRVLDRRTVDNGVPIPAVNGDFFVAVPYERTESGTDSLPRSSLTIHAHRLSDAIVEVSDVLLRKSSYRDRSMAGKPGRLTIDKRVYYYPDSALLVTLPEGDNSVAMRRVDLAEALGATGRDYLAVISTPPMRMAANEQLEYPLRVLSSRGNVRYTLEMGPPGMTVSAEGVLLWRPTEAKSMTASVMIAVTDDSGKIVRQAFNVRISFAATVLAGAQAPPSATSAPPAGFNSAPSTAAAPTFNPKDERIELPAKYDDACLAGGGKYLVLHLPSESKLAVLGIAERKILGEIPTGGGKTLFAAGQDDIVIVKPSDQIAQRYDLKSRQVRQTVKLEVTQPITSVTMGHASNGPVLLGLARAIDPMRRTYQNSRAEFLHLEKLQPLFYPVDSPFRVDFDEGSHVRASADGRVFSMWRTNLSPTGMQSLIVSRSRVGLHYEHSTVGYLRPSASGEQIFTGEGIYATNLTAKERRASGGPYPVPAVSGPMFVCVADPVTGSRAPPGPRLRTVTLHSRSQNEPLVEWKDVQLPALKNPAGGLDKLSTIDTRIYYFPDAEALVTLPEGNDSVVVRRVNLLEELHATGREFLIVTSDPPLLAFVGRAYQYQITAVSKTGGLAYKLEAGPPGMVLSPEGLLRWTPTARPSSGTQNVIVTVADASGRTVLHSFDLRFDGDPASAVAASAPPVGPNTAPPPQTAIPRPPTSGGAPTAQTAPPHPQPPSATAAPPMFEGDELRINLTSKIDDVCLAGGGRYLIVGLPAESRLAVFDVARSQIAGYIPTGGGTTMFTAGADSVVIAKPADNILQRFDLETRKLELTVKHEWPQPQPMTLLGMGRASRGPVLLGLGQYIDSRIQIGVSSEPVFLDLETLKPLAIEFKRSSGMNFSSVQRVRTSADGLRFAISGSQTSGTTVLLTLAGKAASARNLQAGGEYSTLNGYGDLLFASSGIYTDGGQIKETRKADQPLPLPAVSGPFFVSFTDLTWNTKGRGIAAGPVVGIHTRSLTEPLVQIPDVALRWAPRASSSTRVPYTLNIDKRIHYFPESELLVTIPDTDDAIVARRVNLVKELDASGTDYLAVVSAPPSTASLGSPLEYRLKVLSKQGGVTYRLDSGATGMALSPDGVLRWTPTVRPLGGIQNVIITVGDKSGKTVLHTFDLRIERAALAGPANEGPGASPQLAAALVRVDESRQEIVGGGCLPFIGNGDPDVLLLVDHETILVLGPDGFSSGKTVKLDRRYDFMGRRANNFVGVTRSAPHTVDVIDPTGKVARSVQLPEGAALDLSLHPSKPYSYVSINDAPLEMPGTHFVAIDEANGKARQNGDFIGARLIVDPHGRYLYSAYEGIYQRGAELLMNPGRWHVIPTYGSIDLIFKYNLKDPSFPFGESIKDKVGSSRRGLRVSSDGRQLVNVGEVPWGKYRGWHPHDFAQLALTYDLGARVGTANDFAFHPSLPLGAAFRASTVLLFDTESGLLAQNQVTEPKGLDQGELKRLWFSPDGKWLVVLQSINSAHYLVRMPLKLSPEEQAKLPPADGRRPRLLPQASPSAVAAPKTRVPMDKFDSLAGGMGKEMSPTETAKLFADSIVVVRSGGNTGSGFIVGADGYVLTCAHCLSPGDLVDVQYRTVVEGKASTQTARASLLHADEGRDLALLKITSSVPLRSVRLAPPVSVENGESVTVIANPGLGREVLESTLTTGVVSSARRSLDGAEFIQTSAAVNPGSSGGAMFNSRGLVIGTVVLKARIEGAGFAIPARDLTAFLLSAASGDAKNLERQWIDSTGQHVVRAVLLAADEETLTLRRSDDNRALSLPVARLSAGDQGFMELLREASLVLAP